MNEWMKYIKQKVLDKQKNKMLKKERKEEKEKWGSVA